MDEKVIPPIDWKQADALIELALREDLDDTGDTTTNSVIPEPLQATAVFLAKEECVCAGLPVAERLFKTLDPKLDPTTAVRAHILPTITTCLNLFHQKRFSIQLFASLSEAVISAA